MSAAEIWLARSPGGPESLLLDERDVEILRGALTTSHTWCLDALGESIKRANREAIDRNMDTRMRIKAMLRTLGAPVDDRYRMGHLRDAAKEAGVPLRPAT